MQNIPLFTTENGVASLTLQEVPYTGKAYIRIQDSCIPKKLLAECVDFCKIAGAEQIYATGHNFLSAYPLHTTQIQMLRAKEGLPQTDACLFPVQKETLEQWRTFYNEKMRNVSNSAYLTANKAEEYLRQGNCYYIHRNEELLGIGIAGGNTIDAVISLVAGGGADVLLALTNALFSEVVLLEVASDNIRAIRLYEKLGFIKTKEIAQWYKIYDNVK